MATFGMILTTGTPSPIDFSIELILIPATVETIICLDEEKLFVRKGPSTHQLPIKEIANWVIDRVDKI